MEIAEKTSADRWEQVFQRLDQFSDQMAEVKAVQKELLGQSALAAIVAEQAAEERTLLFCKVEETGKVVAQLRLEAKGVELESSSTDSDGCERSHSRH
jgi:hypothetical protein